MISNSIRTQVFPIIFAVSCFLFSMLFFLFYTFVFTSIDQIFSQQNTSELQSHADFAQGRETEFRSTVRMLYMNRSIQRIFTKIRMAGADESTIADLYENLRIWHSKQKLDQYAAAMYIDVEGKPLVAVDFTIDQNYSGTVDMLSDISNVTSRNIPMNTSITATWSIDRLHAKSSYVVAGADGTNMIRSIYSILDRSTKGTNGFLVVDRPLSALLGWNVGRHETLIVVDTDLGKIVFDSSSLENVSRDFTRVYPGIERAKFSQDKSEVPPYAKIELEDRELLVIRQTLPDVEWAIYHTTVLNQYTSGPRSRGRLLVAGALLFLLVSGGAIYTLTKRVQTRSQQLEDANEIVSHHNQLLEQELHTAHDMQMRLMPQENPKLDGYEVVGRCRPATEVGGDFFQYFNIERDKWIFALADVTGHGMKAAVPTMVFSGLLDTEISYSAKPETLMPKLNERLCRILEPRTFVCLSIGELDCNENIMRISNGGCPYPYLYKASKKSVDELNLSAFPLGVRESASYEVINVFMEPGDVVVFCSDGIIEAGGKNGELFGFERVARIIEHTGSENVTAEQMIEKLFDELDTFSVGQERDDDQTIIVVRAEE